jgi:hypothetical protein
MMYDPERSPRNFNPDDDRDGRIAGVLAGRAPDYGGAAPDHNGTPIKYDGNYEEEEEVGREVSEARSAGRRANGARLYRNGGPRDEHLSSDHAPTNEYPEDDDASQGYGGPARSARRPPRFLEDASTESAKPSRTSAIRALGFFLLMAVIGGSSGALWFYYGPDLSSPQLDKTTETLNRLVEEQAKLIQSVAALHGAQDVLQKSIVARDQELQRISAETAALRTEVNGVRAGLADIALRLQIGQSPKSASVPSKRAKGDYKPAAQQAPPQGEARPMAVTPPSQ